MKIIKTADLTGPALDWAVAKCEGMVIEIRPAGACGRPLYVLAANQGYTPWVWKPSTDWPQAGPIIERDGMHVDCLRQGKNPVWEAWPYASGTKDIQQGPTPLIAAMRCYVAAKLGDEVEVPDELV